MKLVDLLKNSGKTPRPYQKKISNGKETVPLLGKLYTNDAKAKLFQLAYNRSSSGTCKTKFPGKKWWFKTNLGKDLSLGLQSGVLLLWRGRYRMINLLA